MGIFFFFYVFPPFAGSVAEREQRKWVENAVKLDYNPYSQENIARRVSRKESFSVARYKVAVVT